MRIISGDEIDVCLEYRSVIETLRQAYRSAALAPHGPEFPIERPDRRNGAFSFHPAWTNFAAQGHTDRGYLGCRVGLTLPEDDDRADLSSVYMLFSGTKGQPIALLDGMRLSAWRHCAVHALAASYLAREDTERLLVIGDHPHLQKLMSSYRAVRRLKTILFAGTDPATLRKIAALPDMSGVKIAATDEIADAASGADMIAIAGLDGDDAIGIGLDQLDAPSGCHIDVFDRLVPLPDTLFEDARVFTYDRSDASEDVLELAADIRELARGERAGRRYYAQTTLFRPGLHTGLADFALAGHVFLRS